MKLSEFWLREWVNLAIDTNALTDRINTAGFEVESIIPVSYFFTDVVIGRVIMCQQRADGMLNTKIDIGNRLLNIVCNAALNCRVNLKVAVATTSSSLLQECKITTKLHDTLSEGMLCSFSDLGMSDDHSDVIVELETDAPIGRDIRDYLQLNDNIIDIKVTSNRADCLSLLGIARDIAAFSRIPLQKPIINPVVPVIYDVLPIRIDEPNACPRYLSRVVKNINIQAITPLWMKERLRRCGVKSINAIIDIASYVLLELGQPIHVFDLCQIEGGLVLHKTTRKETLLLSNRKEIVLKLGSLVISDHKKVLALAGIIESSVAEISSATQDIMLGCAFLDPLVITDCARCYNLYTDTSFRYERGVDPELQLCAMERATALLITICGGKPGRIANVTMQETLLKPATIVLRRKSLDRLIGYVIADEDVTDILIRLGCQVTHIKTDWKVIAPSWRFDIVIEEDLIEEVIRMYGYDAIPNIPVLANLELPTHRETALPLIRVKTLLVDRGYQEVITYSFVNPKLQKLLHPKQVPLTLLNPISLDMSVMRLSLWTGLLSTMLYNQNRQQKRVRLFESGLRFAPDDTADFGIRQDLVLSGMITGSCFEEHWDLIYRSVDFYDLKGDIEAIFELTNKVDDIEFRSQSNPALHPGQSAAVYLKNEHIGFLGVIHPALETKLNLNGRTLMFEFLWEKISKHDVPKVKNISHFPANRRDISLLVKNDISSADIIAECKSTIGDRLVKVNLFDVYQGKGIAEGFKSLAISLILQDNTRTLKEQDIVTTVEKCVAALKHRFQVSLRD